MHVRSAIIVEPSAVMRESLQRILIDRGFTVISTSASFAAMQRNLTLPDDVLVILSASQKTLIEDQIRKIKAAAKAATIVVLGGRWDFEFAVKVLQVGANACLDDETTTEAFVKATELASQNLTVISRPHDDHTKNRQTTPNGVPLTTLIETTLATPARLEEESPQPAIVSAVPAQPQPTLAPRPGAYDDIKAKIGRANPSFSQRESEILGHLQMGEPNKQIARHLSLTEATVKVHLKSILRKIGVNNRTQAAVWASAWRAGESGVGSKSTNGRYQRPTE